MNKQIQGYLQSLTSLLSIKYNIPEDKAVVMIQNSYVIDSLVKYPEDTLHDDIETHADNIYEDWIKERRINASK